MEEDYLDARERQDSDASPRLASNGQAMLGSSARLSNRARLFRAELRRQKDKEELRRK